MREQQQPAQQETLGSGGPEAVDDEPGADAFGPGDRDGSHRATPARWDERTDDEGYDLDRHPHGAQRAGAAAPAHDAAGSVRSSLLGEGTTGPNGGPPAEETN